MFIALVHDRGVEDVLIFTDSISSTQAEVAKRIRAYYVEQDWEGDIVSISVKVLPGTSKLHYVGKATTFHNAPFEQTRDARTYQHDYYERVLKPKRQKETS